MDADAARAEKASGPVSASEVSPLIPVRHWYMLGVLTAINMLGYMDRTALAILLQSIKLDLHLTDGQLGLLTGFAFLISYCAMAIPLAQLADRSSRVTLLACCITLWSGMTALTGSARNFSHLVLARIGVGVGEAGYMPPAHSMIGDTFPPHVRTFAISIFQTGAALGSSVGLIVVGLLGQELGWRAAMQCIGLVGIPVILILLTVREPARPEKTVRSAGSAKASITALLQRPAFVHLLLAIGLLGIASGVFAQWVPTFLIRSFGLSMAQTGASLGLVTLVAGVIGMLSGGLAVTWLNGRDRRWELWLPALATLIAAPLFIAAMLSPTVWLVLAMKVPFSFLASVATGAGMGAVQAFAESRQRGMAISLVQLLSAILGMGIAPYLIGMMSDLLAPTLGEESLRYALVISSVVMPWGALHFYLAARRGAADRVS